VGTDIAEDLAHFIELMTSVKDTLMNMMSGRPAIPPTGHTLGQHTKDLSQGNPHQRRLSDNHIPSHYDGSWQWG